VHSSPAISGSDAVIAGCDGVLRMIDIASGVERHALPVGSYVAASTAIHDGRAYFGTFDNQVLCVDLAEARQVWVYEHPKRQFPFYASAAVSGKLAVIAGRDKLVHALDTRTGEARWTFPLKTRIDASPVICGGRVYLGTRSGEMMALDLESGEAVWEYPTGSVINASAGIGEGKLVVGGEDGMVFCFGKK
ncbi:MAG: PQQ-binding-like beta-propeller repeat protein, partial [Calditrichaeota bacterium]|nr:PQQ-binding-like beta-propeller repeat protein [Calditrichota bacterium]